ncbi:hypothetical protein N8143_05860 [Pelagibacteraceae bacterium]|nr:hypothetical protein [Pelagibacteraceae bacterium]
METINLPYHYYRVFNDFSILIKKNHQETLKYILDNFEPSESKWIYLKFGNLREKIFSIPNPNIDIDIFFSILESLPRNIRPLTDGYYLREYKFLHDEKNLIGIEAYGIKIYDFNIVTAREKSIFPHVKSFFKNMSIDEYRIYNQFNSQFLRLIREPNTYQMPNNNDKNVAIDVGCYVGYKVFALSHYQKNYSRPVLGFEIDDENFDVFNINIKKNKLCDVVKGYKIGLSDEEKILTIYTRQKKTMAHSLEQFENLNENEIKLSFNNKNKIKKNILKIKTHMLDNYTNNYSSISALHVSVNGHEHKVVKGSKKTINKTKKVRISCPYKLNGIPVRKLVIDELTKLRLINPKLHGGAVYL